MIDRKLARTIGGAALTARLRARLLQADVAESLGINPDVYGRMERGLILPSVQTLRKLALALHVPAACLLGLEPLANVIEPIDEDSELLEQLDLRSLRLLIQVAGALKR